MNYLDVQAMRIVRIAERRAKLIAKDRNRRLSKLSPDFGRTFISQTKCSLTQINSAHGHVTQAEIKLRKAAERTERRGLNGVGSAKIDVDQLSKHKVGDATTSRPSVSPFDCPVLDDGFMIRHADALAVADAEVYDAAFDPDFSFSYGWLDHQQRKRVQL